jgi:hypothetical protein
MPIVQWERTDSLKQAELFANEISQTSNGEEAHTTSLRRRRNNLSEHLEDFPHHVTPSDPPHPVDRAVLRGCGMPQGLDRLPGAEMTMLGPARA